MITASVVLYHTEKYMIERIVNSYRPDNNRILFIIDNSESKDYEVYFKENCFVEYIHNGKNVGYGAGHNIGIRRAIQLNSDYHIVLNPDVSFEDRIIDELKTYADNHEEVVYMLPKVVYPNGKIQYLCKLLPTPLDLTIRRFFPNIGLMRRRNEKYVLKASGYNKIMNPPCLSGCFMFMRTSTLRDNNLLFDENFFMYCEDFDLIRRLHRVGMTIFYPNVTIVHDHTRASYKNWKLMLIHIQSAFKYFNKYGWFHDKERIIENNKILKDIDDE